MALQSRMNQDLTLVQLKMRWCSLAKLLYKWVSINKGTPKWMVCTENPIKMDDLGVPLVQETSITRLVGIFAKYRSVGLYRIGTRFSGQFWVKIGR